MPLRFSSIKKFPVGSVITPNSNTVLVSTEVSNYFQIGRKGLNTYGITTTKCAWKTPKHAVHGH